MFHEHNGMISFFSILVDMLWEKNKNTDIWLQTYLKPQFVAITSSFLIFQDFWVFPLGLYLSENLSLALLHKQDTF